MGRLRIISLILLTVAILCLALYQIISPVNGAIYNAPGSDAELMRWSRPFNTGYPGTDDDEGGTNSVILIFGTDADGMDLAFRLSKGVATSIALSFFGAAIIFTVLGTVLGIIIGFNRVRTMGLLTNPGSFKKINVLRTLYQWLQSIMDHFLQIINAIPLLLILLIAVIVIEKTMVDASSLVKMFASLTVYGMLSTPKLAFLIKDKIKSLEDEEFIDAARASGISDWKLVITHIIRYECISIIFLQGINILIQGIMVETVISFFGYGVQQQKFETIGKLINEFKTSLGGAMGEPVAVIPIFVLLAIALIGNGWSKEFLAVQHE